MRYGILLDAWTMDITDPAAVRNVPPLLAAGVDLFTTNTPGALAESGRPASGAAVKIDWVGQRQHPAGPVAHGYQAPMPGPTGQRPCF